MKDNFTVRKIPSSETWEWLLKKHYAHRIPSISYAFGLYDSDTLVGVCTFGKPPSPPLCVGIAGSKYSEYVIELNRLCLESDEKNITSWFVSKCLSYLGTKIIVSYADTEQGHIGKIYQACNFLYTGLSDKRTEWRMHNSGLHSKTICETYSLEHRKLNSDIFYEIDRPRKHRYIYITGDKKFRREALKSLRYEIQPYPKGDTQRYDASYKPKVQGVLF